VILSGISNMVLTEEAIIILGVLEQIIFPEINIDKVNKINGMDITFVTSATTDKEAKSLLKLGLPFKKN
jgi:large subunit ribosomal protein L5